MPNPLPPLPSLLSPIPSPTIQVYTSHPLHPITPLLLRHISSSTQQASLLVSFTDHLRGPSKTCKSISLLSSPAAAISLSSVRQFWDAVRKEAAGKPIVVLHGLDILPCLGTCTAEEVVAEILETLVGMPENGRVVVVLEDGLGGGGIVEGLGGQVEAFVGVGHRADGTVRISRGPKGWEGIREGEWVYGEERWCEVDWE